MYNDNVAHIECVCGERFQVIRTLQEVDDNGNIVGEYEDWDEAKTAELYYAHWDVCPGPPKEGE